MPEKRDLKRLAQLAKKKRTLFLLQQRLSTDATLPSMGPPVARRNSKLEPKDDAGPSLSRLSRTSNLKDSQRVSSKDSSQSDVKAKDLSSTLLNNEEAKNYKLKGKKSSIPSPREISPRGSKRSSVGENESRKSKRIFSKEELIPVTRQSLLSKPRDSSPRTSKAQTTKSRDASPNVSKLHSAVSIDSSPNVSKLQSLKSRDACPQVKKSMNMSKSRDSSPSVIKSDSLKVPKVSKSRDNSPTTRGMKDSKSKKVVDSALNSLNLTPSLIKSDLKLPAVSKSRDNSSTTRGVKDIESKKALDNASKSKNLSTSSIKSDLLKLSSVSKPTIKGMKDSESRRVFEKSAELAKHGDGGSFKSNISSKVDLNSKSVDHQFIGVDSISDSHALLLVKPIAPKKSVIDTKKAPGRPCIKKELKRLIQPVKIPQDESWRKGRPKGSKNRTWLSIKGTKSKLRDSSVQAASKQTKLKSKVPGRRCAPGREFKLTDKRQLKKENCTDSIFATCSALESKETDGVENLKEEVLLDKFTESSTDVCENHDDIKLYLDATPPRQEPEQISMVTQTTQSDFSDMEVESFLQKEIESSKKSKRKGKKKGKQTATTVTEIIVHPTNVLFSATSNSDDISKVKKISCESVASSLTEYMENPTGDSVVVPHGKKQPSQMTDFRKSDISNVSSSKDSNECGVSNIKPSKKIVKPIVHTVTEFFVRPTGEATPFRVFTSKDDDIYISADRTVSCEKEQVYSKTIDHGDIQELIKISNLKEPNKVTDTSIKESSEEMSETDMNALVEVAEISLNKSIGVADTVLNSSIEVAKTDMKVPMVLGDQTDLNTSVEVAIEKEEKSSKTVEKKIKKKKKKEIFTYRHKRFNKKKIRKANLSLPLTYNLPITSVAEENAENTDIPVLSPTDTNFSASIHEDLPSPVLNMPVLINEQLLPSNEFLANQRKKRGRPRIHPPKIKSGRSRGRPRRCLVEKSLKTKDISLPDSLTLSPSLYLESDQSSTQIYTFDEESDCEIVKDILDTLIKVICEPEVEADPVIEGAMKLTTPTLEVEHAKPVITSALKVDTCGILPKSRGRRGHKRRGRPPPSKSKAKKSLSLQVSSSQSLKWKIDHSSKSGSPEGSTKLVFKRRRKVYKSMSERENSLFLAGVEQLMKEKEQDDNIPGGTEKSSRARQFMLRQKVSRSPLEILAMKEKLEDEEYEKSKLPKRKYTRHRPKVLLSEPEIKEILPLNGPVEEMRAYCRPCYVPVINLVPFMHKYLQMEVEEQEFYHSSDEGDMFGDSDHSYVQIEDEQTEDDSLDEDLRFQIKTNTVSDIVCEKTQNEEPMKSKIEELNEDGYIGSFVEFLKKNKGTPTIKPRIQRVAKVSPILKTPVSTATESQQKIAEPSYFQEHNKNIIASKPEANNKVSSTITSEPEISSSNVSLSGISVPSIGPSLHSPPQHQQSSPSSQESRSSDASKSPSYNRPVSSKYFCKSCEFSSPSKPTIEIHIYTHLPNVVFRCGICLAQFQYLVAVQSHQQTHHPDLDHHVIKEPDVKEEELYNCVVESPSNQPLIISLVVQGNLSLNTSSIHNPTTRFVCTHCQYSTNVKNDINQHVLDLHQQNELFVCTLCDRSLYHSTAEITNHCRATHPSRPDCFRKLPKFYDCEQLAEGERERFDGRGNIFERMTNLLNPSQPDDGKKEDTTHIKRARQYLHIQDAMKNKTSAEADSTTAWDTPIEESKCEDELPEHSDIDCVSSGAKGNEVITQTSNKISCVQDKNCEDKTSDTETSVDDANHIFSKTTTVVLPENQEVGESEMKENHKLDPITDTGSLTDLHAIIGDEDSNNNNADDDYDVILDLDPCEDDAQESVIQTKEQLPIDDEIGDSAQPSCLKDQESFGADTENASEESTSAQSESNPETVPTHEEDMGNGGSNVETIDKTNEMLSTVGNCDPLPILLSPKASTSDILFDQHSKSVDEANKISCGSSVPLLVLSSPEALASSMLSNQENKSKGTSTCGSSLASFVLSPPDTSTFMSLLDQENKSVDDTNEIMSIGGSSTSLLALSSPESSASNILIEQESKSISPPSSPINDTNKCEAEVIVEKPKELSDEQMEEESGFGQLKIINVISLQGQVLSPKKHSLSQTKESVPSVPVNVEDNSRRCHRREISSYKAVSSPSITHVDVDDIVLRNERLTCTYKCKTCNVHAPFLSVIVEHLVFYHKSICVFSCPYCRISEGKKPDFKTESDLRQHIAKFHPSYFAKKDTSLSDSAKEIVQVVAIPSSLDTQRVSKTLGIERDIYMCQKCSTHMPSLEYMYSHIESEHGDVFLHVCPECKKFKHKSDKIVYRHIEQVHKKNPSSIELSLAMEDNLLSRVYSISKNGVYNDKVQSSSDKTSPRAYQATSVSKESNISRDTVLKTLSCVSSNVTKKKPTARKSIKRSDDIQQARAIMHLSVKSPSISESEPRPILGSQLFTDSTTGTTPTVTTKMVAAFIPVMGPVHSHKAQVPLALPQKTISQATKLDKLMPNILSNPSPRPLFTQPRNSSKTVAQQLKERNAFKQEYSFHEFRKTSKDLKTTAQQMHERKIQGETSNAEIDSDNWSTSNSRSCSSYTRTETLPAADSDFRQVQSRKFSMTDKLHRLGKQVTPTVSYASKPVLKIPTLEKVRNLARPKSIGQEAAPIDLSVPQDMSHYPGILRPPSAPAAMRPPNVIPVSSPSPSFARSSPQPSLLFPRGLSPNQQGIQPHQLTHGTPKQGEDLPPDAFKIFNLKPSKSPIPFAKSSPTPPPIPNLMGPFPQLVNVPNAFQMTQIPVAQLQAGIQGQAGQIIAQGFPGFVLVQPTQALNIPAANLSNPAESTNGQISATGHSPLPRVSGNFECPYCPTILEHHAVIPHIQNRHQGCAIMFKPAGI